MTLLLHVLDMVSARCWTGWEALEEWDRTRRQL